MSYLNDVESELVRVGVPARRRARILTELEDHLLEDPQAELGAPRDLARQFADQLGTQSARRAAFLAFGMLAFAAAVLIAVLFGGERLLLRTQLAYARYWHTPDVPTWYICAVVVCLLSAQVSLASGCLAVLRAFRLRRLSAISTTDARVLRRRTTVALLTGAVAMLILPLSCIASHVPLSGRWWLVAEIGGPATSVALLATIAVVRRTGRVIPALDGYAGDLKFDIGLDSDAISSAHVAFGLCATIVLALTAAGVAADDPYDGLVRGLIDATACFVGFIGLGQYLGLRSCEVAPTRSATPPPALEPS